MMKIQTIVFPCLMAVMSFSAVALRAEAYIVQNIMQDTGISITVQADSQINVPQTDKVYSDGKGRLSYRLNPNEPPRVISIPVDVKYIKIASFSNKYNDLVLEGTDLEIAKWIITHAVNGQLSISYNLNNKVFHIGTFNELVQKL